MDQANNYGLTLEEIGMDTDRSMQTSRRGGDHVTSISYTMQTDRQGIQRRGFWVQLVDYPDLTVKQRAYLEQHLTKQVAFCLEKTLGGQK